MNAPISEQEQNVRKLFDNIERLKYEQEARRDQLAVLIAGGALTLSFPFVAGLNEAGELVRLCYLAAAWVLWTVALVGSLAGYTLSIYAFGYAERQLSRGEERFDQITPRYAHYIEPLNLTVIICVVVGFIMFGIFALGNLGHVKETPEGTRQEESNSKAQGQERDEGIYNADGASRVAPQDDSRGKEMNTPRENEERGLTLPVQPPRYAPTEQQPQQQPSQQPPPTPPQKE